MKIGSVANVRSECLVASLSPDRIIIVGGRDELTISECEDCVVV